MGYAFVLLLCIGFLAVVHMIESHFVLFVAFLRSYSNEIVVRMTRLIVMRATWWKLHSLKPVLMDICVQYTTGSTEQEKNTRLLIPKLVSQEHSSNLENQLDFSKILMAQTIMQQQNNLCAILLLSRCLLSSILLILI